MTKITVLFLIIITISLSCNQTEKKVAQKEVKDSTEVNKLVDKLEKTDNEYYSRNEYNQPDVFVFGGIVVNDSQLKELRKNIEKVKSKYFDSRFPVKWNIKDLKKIYLKKGYEKEFNILLSNADEIRREILMAAEEIDYKIIVSAIESTSGDAKKLKERKTDLSIYSFVMGLQRFGLEIQYNSDSAAVILDWPDKSDNSKFNLEYATAYNQGKSTKGNKFNCGNLANLGFNDSIFYTTMLNSTALQLTDIIVGTTREYLETITKPNKATEFKTEMFKMIKPKFRGYPSFFQKGLIISSNSPNIYKEMKKK